MGETDTCTSKQRLRPWLEGLLNNNHINSENYIPGLRWLNEQKTKFRIPWFHGGKQGWIPAHGQIYKEWAVHTGKHREGVDSPEWVTWKTRLRCALNKAHDIKELKEESQSSADAAEPYKVYVFLPRQSNKKKPTVNNRVTSAVENPAVNYACQTAFENAPLPVMVQECRMNSEEGAIPPDLKSIPSGSLLQADPVNLSAMSVDMLSFGNLPAEEKPPELVTAGTAAAGEFELKVYYCNKPIYEKTITTPSGCRLYYGDGLGLPFEQLPTDLTVTLCCPESPPDCIWLPPCFDLMADKRMESMVQHVLERGMEKGVFVRCQNNNIVVCRLCKCSIFYASQIGTNGEPVKLNLVLRDADIEADYETVVFDYQNSFLPALEKFQKGEGLLPDPRVFLLIGSEKCISEINQSVPIYATVATKQALLDVKAAASAMVDTELMLNDLADITKSMTEMSLDSITMPEGYEFQPETTAANVAQTIDTCDLTDILAHTSPEDWTWEAQLAPFSDLLQFPDSAALLNLQPNI